MRDYDPGKPLISLHIPKCAGQSLREILNTWFGEGFYIHYYQQNDDLPPRHPLGAGTCVHGHFQRNKKMGVEDYYPGTDQFITILRNPLEMHVSNYFFWRRKARERQLERGIIQEGGEHDYTDINDFFIKRPKSAMLNFLPLSLETEDYMRYFEEKFVWVGTVEHFAESVALLAERLGFSNIPVRQMNSSARDEQLSPLIRKEFIDNNRFEFEIFYYIRANWYVS